MPDRPTNEEFYIAIKALGNVACSAIKEMASDVRRDLGLEEEMTKQEILSTLDHLLTEIGEHDNTAEAIGHVCKWMTDKTKEATHV